jgi:hypothetical protein
VRGADTALLLEELEAGVGKALVDALSCAIARPDTARHVVAIAVSFVIVTRSAKSLKPLKVGAFFKSVQKLTIPKGISASAGQELFKCP